MSKIGERVSRQMEEIQYLEYNEYIAVCNKFGGKKKKRNPNTSSKSSNPWHLSR